MAPRRARRLAPIRGQTLTGGVALGGVILLIMGVLGVIEGDSQAPSPDPEAAPERAGPLTGFQPELQRALLTGEDLTVPGATASPAPVVVPATTAPQPAPAAPADEPRAVSEACRALFEDPAGLPALVAAATPRETSTRDTTGRGGSVLHQVLSVFEENAAPDAYDHLREAAVGCDEFSAILDGSPVTVLVRELAGDRRESAWAGADEAYAMGVTVVGEAETLVGWLALDRVGPVISVLRHLGPESAPAGDVAETRRTALGKLRPLLRLLDRRPVEAR